MSLQKKGVLVKFISLWRNLKKRRGVGILEDKRQKFVLAVAFLTMGLVFAEFQFSKSGFLASFFLAFFTDIFLFWALKKDLLEKKVYEIFILPFLYSLAFGLFTFLVTSQLSKILLALIYAFGLYSVYLSQNIFVVSSARTIALLSGARIVSFVVTLVIFFLLTNVVLSFHLIIFPILILIASYSFFLLYHLLWSYTLQKFQYPLIVWVSILTMCLLELATVLWFWQSKPAIISLFLTGFFYIVGGLSHIWLERRFFKGIMWEYAWVGFVVFFVLLVFSG